MGLHPTPILHTKSTIATPTTLLPSRGSLRAGSPLDAQCYPPTRLLIFQTSLASSFMPIPEGDVEKCTEGGTASGLLEAPG